MALIRKENTPYEIKGMQLQDVYGVIDDENTDKGSSSGRIYLDIYGNEAAAAKDANSNRNKANILKRISETMPAEDYKAYIKPEVIAANGDQYYKYYQWLKTIKETIPNPDFDNGAEESETNKREISVLKYRDWVDKLEEGQTI